jgi:hypothetical protein
MNDKKMARINAVMHIAQSRPNIAAWQVLARALLCAKKYLCVALEKIPKVR